MRNSAPLILAIFLSSAFAHSAVLCKRGPEAQTVMPQYTGVNSNVVISDVSKLRDPCSGTAIVQAFQYKCGKVADVDSNTSEFFDNVVDAARKTCESHCRDRAKGCMGEFQAPPRCGLSISKKDAADAGKYTAECADSCEGQAFSYCSVVHAGFTSFDQSLFVGKKPNCSCRWKNYRN